MTHLKNIVNKYCGEISLFTKVSIRKPTISLLILFAAAITSGCQLASEESIEDPQHSLLDLHDVVWTLESFDNIAGPQPVIKNTIISLSMDIENMQLQGMGGCNSYIAEFVLDEVSGDITILNIINTERWCDEPENIMLQEQEFFATLRQIRFFTFDKSTLNMTVGADAGLNFVANQPALEDVVWLLESFDNIAGPQPVIENTQISLSVDMENMGLNGSGGCNIYTSSFVIDKTSNTMTVSNVISTQMWCDEPENTMEQEQEFFATLMQIQSFTFDKTTLNLVVGADAGLNFVAKQPVFNDLVWTLESFDNIAGPQPVIKNTHVSLSIDMANMSINGSGGCNIYTASFVLDEASNTITVSNVSHTEMWCNEPESIMQQEQEFFATLVEIQSFNVDKTTLNLVVGADAGLNFVVTN
ncbi:MAG: META domain-containing protein [Colwellia sp.]|nr:META domain-containing protein [Colwellia sp.]